MKCVLCLKNKLRRDFPGCPLSPNCNHPPSCCLRCVTTKVPETGKCPFPACGIKVNKDGCEMGWVTLRLQQLYPEICNTWESQSTDDVLGVNVAGKMTIYVAVLNGDTKAIHVTLKLAIYELKEIIEEKMGIEKNKQQLVYQGKNLELMDVSYQVLTLDHYDVQPNSTIHLLVMLYDIPERLDHVVFDLSWGYPGGIRDYLDASCWAFNKNGFQQGDPKPGGGFWKRTRSCYRESKPGPRGATAVIHTYLDDWEFYRGRVDYFSRALFSLEHSGDDMDDSNGIGHQTIDMHLQEIPEFISHLVFTLSSYKAPSIAHFPNPSLSFYDANDESETPLCSTDLHKAQSRNAQAIIMCFVARTRAGWRIYESGALSAGNAAYHKPLIATMKELIKSGMAG